MPEKRDHLSIVPPLSAEFDVGSTRTHGEVASILGMLEPSVALCELQALSKLRNAGDMRAASQLNAD